VTETPTPQELRTAATDALRPLGERRLELLKELAKVDAELKPLVKTAIANEVSLRTIHSITGLATGTATQWAKG
jgi:hypothetical protein